ncbi:MAG: hypothetical protein ABW223_12510 [Rariglobus sp.]
MISQTHTLPPKPAVSFDSSAHFDVLWGKPVFRAPDLPANVNASVAIPSFTPHRVTETRTAK